MEAEWESVEGESHERLRLEEGPLGVVATSTVAASGEGKPFELRYVVACDRDWHTRRVNLELVGTRRALVLEADGRGNWSDAEGRSLPHLAGALDVDVSATPFTNTLPIRRLGLQPSQSRELQVAYVDVPTLLLDRRPQGYERLAEQRYRFRSLDSDFVRDLDVDGAGLVVHYPGLFRRVR